MKSAVLTSKASNVYSSGRATGIIFSWLFCSDWQWKCKGNGWYPFQEGRKKKGKSRKYQEIWKENRKLTEESPKRDNRKNERKEAQQKVFVGSSVWACFWWRARTKKANSWKPSAQKRFRSLQQKVPATYCSATLPFSYPALILWEGFASCSIASLNSLRDLWKKNNKGWKREE